MSSTLEALTKAPQTFSCRLSAGIDYIGMIGSIKVFTLAYVRTYSIELLEEPKSSGNELHHIITFIKHHFFHRTYTYCTVLLV